ncbi:MAG: type II toxin-antitoxin system RelE/ParE family toxin [Parcubacteria group bacterium]|nr:type II toxin-antitoxin system RelE/ParE family toxin [Parcubacteria group bacterium]
MYAVTYHHLVKREDIPALPDVWKQKIKRAIEERLMTYPDLYGKPLRKSLKGYRKLRVGDYRVIFSIEENAVKILIIQHRGTVYTEIKKRVA